MDDLEPSRAPDVALADLCKADLYDLSVGDLETRIANLKAEIARCETALAARGSSRAAAESLFKS